MQRRGIGAWRDCWEEGIVRQRAGLDSGRRAELAVGRELRSSPRSTTPQMVTGGKIREVRQYGSQVGGQKKSLAPVRLDVHVITRFS